MEHREGPAVTRYAGHVQLRGQGVELVRIGVDDRDVVGVGDVTRDVGADVSCPDDEDVHAWDEPIEDCSSFRHRHDLSLRTRRRTYGHLITPVDTEPYPAS